MIWYRCGVEALRQLKRLIGSSKLRCVGDKTDKYNRILATCYIGNININKKLVEIGWAVAFLQNDKTYSQQELKASINKRGLWQGKFERPEKDRQQKWNKSKSSVKQESGSECPIKAISIEMAKKYHTPWGSAHYNRTKINVAMGERWFCSESDATVASWRAPYR